jgi:hypothetical protein
MGSRSTEHFVEKDTSMVTDFDDFCIRVFVLIDDIWKAECSDIGLIETLKGQ